jgi:hypothetical protein
MIQERFETKECRNLPNVVERVIDSALLWLALMLLEIRLELQFGFVGVSYKFPSCPEG